MIAHKTVVQRYFRTIRSYLPCSRKLKKRIINEIEISVNSFLGDHPDATIVDVRARCGEPQNIAAAYVDDMNTPELLHALRVRRKVITGIVAGIIAALLMWASCLGYLLDRYDKDYNGEIKTSNVEIIESNE